MKRFYQVQSFKHFIPGTILHYVVVLLAIFPFIILNAQVRTTILGNGQKISTIVPGYTTEQPEVIILPKVDVRNVLEEDREKDKRLYRIGIKIPVGYTEQDGQWYVRQAERWCGKCGFIPYMPQRLVFSLRI